MLWITLVLFIVGGEVAQMEVSGDCKIPNVMKDFNPTKFMGKWYEAAKYTDKLEFQCAAGTYSLSKNDVVYFKINKIIPITGQAPNLDATLTPIDDFHKGNYNAEFLKTPALNGIYSILATNYVDWAVIQSCSSPNGKSTVTSYILTKKPSPTNAVMNSAFAAAAKNKFKRDGYKTMDSKNCA